MSNHIAVAVAVIKNREGEILIAKRAANAHQGGLWEFPGGKLEPGETPLAALQREIHEEVGLHIEQARPLITLPYHYPDKSVCLHVFYADVFQGTPAGKEGQTIAWARPNALQQLDFPAANQAIITALQLPPYYLITGDPSNETQFLNRLEAALESGIRLVQLRAKTLSRLAYQQLAQKSIALCREYEARLLLNAPVDWAAEIEADGLHLSAENLLALDARPLGKEKWVAASCHDAAELAQATHINVDFAVLSPVHATGSHPDALPLTWAGFETLAYHAPFPVYGLGGLGPESLETAWQHQAQGIAGITQFWR